MTLYVYMLASKPQGTLYVGVTNDLEAAIAREKKLKRWRRDWKRALVEENNPYWADLLGTIAPGFAVGPGSPLSGRSG